MKATEKGIKDSMSSSKASKSETAKLAAKTVARLYFLDLSAGRILTSNPDGSDLKTIVNEGRKLPDGIVVDVARGHIYWTNMGSPKANDGTIDRADLEIPRAQPPVNRKAIEVLYDTLPEPIDLDLDLGNRVIYWTDRGDPPRGNTVNRAAMDAVPGKRKEPEIVFNHLMEGIGLSLDLENNRMFLTDLGGSVYSANLDGSNKKNIVFAEGNLSGIAYAEIGRASCRERV